MSTTVMTNEEILTITRKMRIAAVGERFVEISQTPEFMNDAIGGRELVSTLLTALRDSRDSSRIARDLRKLGLDGQRLTIQDMNFNDRKGISRSQVQELLCCEYVRVLRPVVITGATGLGKQWICRLLCTSAVLQGIKCYMAPLSDILADLEELSASGVRSVISGIASHDLVVITKFGDAALDQEKVSQTAQLLGALQGNTSFILAGQTDMDDWSKVCFGGNREMNSALDYIASNALVFRLTGKSLRPLYAPALSSSLSPVESAQDGQKLKTMKAKNTPESGAETAVYGCAKPNTTSQGAMKKMKESEKMKSAPASAFIESSFHVLPCQASDEEGKK